MPVLILFNLHAVINLGCLRIFKSGSFQNRSYIRYTYFTIFILSSFFRYNKDCLLLRESLMESTSISTPYKEIKFLNKGSIMIIIPIQVRYNLSYPGFNQLTEIRHR